MSELSKAIDLLNSLKPYIEELSKNFLFQESIYFLILKSALVKSFEFSLFVWQPDRYKDSFFYTATLRGICEDIITLKFINNLEEDDRNCLIKNIFYLDILEKCESQVNFFSKERPFQKIYRRENIENLDKEAIRERAREIVKRYNGKLNNKYATLPTVYSMAQNCNLDLLYDYIYSATSRLVHFNPSILMRMNWGSEENVEYDNQISTENFAEYYLAFNRFYANYLFLLHCNIFKDELPFKEDFYKLLEELRVLLDNELRWPEIITFEEMNIEPPSPFIYSLLQRFHSNRDRED